ncbi:MAG: putative colanic acid biosynthesis acetyltransferase [Phycisphaerae bacterium]|nr:putative colanic acid biosynthesis acetyltransferase [Phycisphaerae bacterium]
MDISDKPSPHSSGNRLARAAWGIVWLLLFRPSPRPFHRWRALLLKLFGARISWRSRVYPACRVWGPWNLEMEEHATLADRVDCYCVDRVRIGAHTTVSQYSYLCGATHDHEHARFPLRPAPITIGRGCWLAADVFVGPGVTIGDGAVVGARSSVFDDLPAWKICLGTPARPVKDRVLRSGAAGERGPA